MNQPLVSIITPVYKVEKYIDRCIQSIITQKYKNFELILIDDGSPERCGLICDEYSRKDQRIRVIHKQNGGVSAARNNGLDVARGEYIAFVDSDDFVAPEFLELPIKSMLASGADMAVFNVGSSGKKNNKVIGWNIPSDNLSSKQLKGRLMLGNDCQIWRKIYKRKVWDTVRFPVGKNYEDIYINASILEAAKYIIAIPQVLYFYELGQQESITKNIGIKNRQDELDAWMNLYHCTKRSKEFYEFQDLMRYCALAAWNKWAYLATKDKLFSRNEIIEKMDEIYTPPKETITLEDMIIGYYIAKTMIAHERMEWCKKSELDFYAEEKDMVRQGMRAVCFFSCLPGEQNPYRDTVENVIKKNYLRDAHIPFEQKWEWLSIKYNLIGLMRIKGNRLLKKMI